MSLLALGAAPCVALPGGVARAVATGALVDWGFFACAVALLPPVDGCGATATPLFAGGTWMISGSSSMPDDCVWLFDWPGAVLGGAGWAACGTGWPGVLPCSARFGSYCAPLAAPLSGAAGGATFETNGVGARVM